MNRFILLKMSPYPSLIPLSCLFLLASYPIPRQHWRAFGHCSLHFIEFYMNGIHSKGFFFWLLLLSTIMLRCICLAVCISILNSFYCWVVLHCMDILQYVYPFNYWWEFGFFPMFGYYNWTYERLYMKHYLDIHFNSLGYIPRRRKVGSLGNGISSFLRKCQTLF